MRNAGDGRGPGWACPLLQQTVVPHDRALLPLSLHMLPSLSEMWSDWLLLEQHLVAYNIYPLEEKKKHITFVQGKTSLELCPSFSCLTLALITTALLSAIPHRALHSSSWSPLNLFLF